MNRANKMLTAEIVSLTIIFMLSGCGESGIIRGPVVGDKLVNGVYEAGYTRFPNSAVVKVTIKNSRILNIEVVSHAAWKGKKAELPIIERIIENQSTKVDAVTGATNSSEVIMKAVQKAIEKAYQK